MTGGERLAKVAEVLAGHCILSSDEQRVDGEWTWGINCECGEFVPDGQQNAHVAQALAPLLDTFRAEDEARALREAAEEIGSSVSYGFGMRHDGTEDSQAMAYVEGLRDAWQIVNNRADRIGGDA